MNNKKSAEFDIREYYNKIDVLDNGYIELFDGPRENPLLKIVNTARVSFLKESKELTDKDEKLIKFLSSHRHYSTFRHSHFSFRIKMPLNVVRQAWKHQIGSDWENSDELADSVILASTSFNEASGRYIVFQPDFYIPEYIRLQSKNNKQGSYGRLDKLESGEDAVEFFKKSCLNQYENYKKIINSGGAKEQARMLLPQNVYTECIWTLSLQAISYFLELRLKSDAQMEIREYAKEMLTLLKPVFEPVLFNREYAAKAH